MLVVINEDIQKGVGRIPILSYEFGLMVRLLRISDVRGFVDSSEIAERPRRLIVARPRDIAFST